MSSSVPIVEAPLSPSQPPPIRMPTVNPDAQQQISKEQLRFFAQMQSDITRQAVEDQSFEELDCNFRMANVAYQSAIKNGSITPKERRLYQKLRTQHNKAKSEKDKLKRPKTRNDIAIKEGKKRKRASSPPLFVGQNESDHDGKSGSFRESDDLKRKPDTKSTLSSVNDGPVGKNETAKQSTSCLIAEAPLKKKQAAIYDSPRVSQAIGNFQPDTIRYSGDGEWSVDGMETPLRTHQVLNVGWMRGREMGTDGPKGGILADQMGLGKTVSSLTSMIQGKSLSGLTGPTTNLVIVPKSLKDQWTSEALRHPTYSNSKDILGIGQVHVYNPSTAPDIEIEQFERADIVIATYPELVSGFKLRTHRYPAKADKETHFDKEIRPRLCALFRFKFRAIFLDEGHIIRNMMTAAARAVLKLEGEFFWVLTGTPMTNSPEDLFSLLTFMGHPEVLNLTFAEFKARHKGDDKNGIDAKWISGLLENCMSRWTYDDELFGRPLIGIPKPSIVDRVEELSPAESIIYSVVCDRLQQLGYAKADGPDGAVALTYVKNQLMLLRQMIGHVLTNLAAFKPLTDEDMVKMEHDISLTSDPYAQDYIEALQKIRVGITCVVCRESAQDVQWTKCHHIYCGDCFEEAKCLASEQNLGCARCVECDGPVGQIAVKSAETQDDPEEKSRPKEKESEPKQKKAEPRRWLNKNGKVIPSTKSSISVEYLESWWAADPKAKAVVFTSFKDSHRLLAATFKEKQWKTTLLTSDMSGAERNESVKRFTEDPEILIMLAMSGVGEVGLNLTMAQYLINYDNYFNESTELQTRGRIHRIGQEKKTMMVSLTVSGTVDEHIVDIKLRKKNNIHKVMEASETEKAKALLLMFKEFKGGDLDGKVVWEDDTGIELETL
ncbi:hypothetical protein E4T39_06344 [Aureobasidium subglaciale]|nr:hypothetical protein E4T39_06344 [Aureobasidium subglaciale]